MRIRFLITVATLGLATSALAQDTTDDWEIVRPDDKTVFAYVPMTTGLTIAFRCVDGVYGAVIAGLPSARRQDRTRILRLGIGGEEPRDTVWNVTTDRTVAIADYPAPLAREMRAGGDVSIVIPGGADDGRNLRQQLELPASSAAIDETLSACDRPLTDPRDALLPEIEETGQPSGSMWATPPRPRFPAVNYNEGYAVLSCLLQPSGGLEQCVVESEFPDDGGFGRASLRAIDDARIESPNETVGQYTPRIIAFRVKYLKR